MERNNSQYLKGEIKIANTAGIIDNKINGNAYNKIISPLLHTPKAGFTYAPGVKNLFLRGSFEYGKKHILSTFLPDIQQKRAWQNSCRGGSKKRVAT